ncbi:hypothetical protein SAMN04487934_103189 [Eubacterium ruminantium]|nr:hypothetical protein SAMN04487934_103189 [Eubacterium ruminantium]
MFDGIWDKITSAFTTFVDYFFWGVFWFSEVATLWVVDLVEQVMMVFTGENEVTYGNTKGAMVNIFFGHKAVRGIYTGIAAIGIAFSFAFAIISIIRKTADLRGKQQGMTLGIIVGNLVKSIVLIFSMNAIVLVSLTATNVLTQSVSRAVQKGTAIADGDDYIKFTEDHYAAMGRIINTIGNYSVNPSYRSRYNLNACYNDIRKDLQYLGEQGVFNFHYVTMDPKDDKKTIPTWQSIMENLAHAYNYYQEIPLDSYDDGITSAILNAIETFQKNPTIMVLPDYKRDDSQYSSDIDGHVPLSRILFLVGTMGNVTGYAAARNDLYNKNMSFTDGIRYPFYIGEKSIYNYEEVRKAFSPSPVFTNYIVVSFSAVCMVREMLIIIMTCGVRIFNLLALYLAAPLFIAVLPLDDGGKLKQWTTAFIIQLLSVVGMILSMRLFLMLLPVIWSPEWHFITYDNVVGNFLSSVLLDNVIKIVLTYNAMQSIGKINGVFTGILADNAGMQAIYAGNMRDTFDKSAVGKFFDTMTGEKVMRDGFEKDPNADAKKEKAQEKQNKKDQTNLANDIDHAKKTGRHNSANGGQRLGKNEMEKMEKTLGYMGQGMSYNEASDKASRDVNKAAKRDKDMKTLKADIDFASENGRHATNGKELGANELDVMNGAYGYMQQGFDKKEAFELAKQDLKDGKLGISQEAERENKLPPPDRNKAIEAARKMDDNSYKRMVADYNFASANDRHLNGNSLGAGELGQMKETLDQYEALHLPQNQRNNQ